MPKYEVRGGAAAYTSARTSTHVIPGARVQTREAPRWELDRARAALRELAELQADWDGYGAEPLAQRVRLNAWHAFEQGAKLGLIADPTPRANGTVSLEWEIESIAAHLQVGDSSYSMYVSTPKGTHYFSGKMSEGVASGLLALRAAVDDHVGTAPDREPRSR